MEKSKVYFTNFRTSVTENLLDKLKRLMYKAGIKDINFENQFTAIKLHFGEYGNLAFLRPNYAKVVADVVKELGGKPFLTDCNTLYVGSRKNALDHLDTAMANGFFPLATGCQVVIADGLRGYDSEDVPVKGGEFVKSAKIGKAIMDADVFISLTHFKGHECTGFGGALKNIGMGSGSIIGKMEMHNSGKPYMRRLEQCIGCGLCEKNCAHGAIKVSDKKASLDRNKCVGCGRCVGVCPTGAVACDNNEVNDKLNKKIAEYSYAVLHGRPCFHISLVTDVSPCCDCHSENDAPIIPNVGMFASFDPVALDKACVDMVNAQPVIEGSYLSEQKHNHHDHFTDTHPDTDWKVCLEHAERLGLGTEEYELIEI